MSTSTERVKAALEEIRAGKMVVLVDDEDRENEGDLCMAAEKITPEAINFMATWGRGLICLTLDEAQIERLQLPMMVTDNQASLGTAFTVSIEARLGVSTGISAKDRAHTVRVATDDNAKPSDIVSPGHIFPLKARKGGVLVRAGQTEGSIDLSRLAGLKASGVICEIMRDDGEMARMPDLEKFAAKHDLMIVTIADLIAYRLEREQIVRRQPIGSIRPGQLGDGEPFTAFAYTTEVEETEYLALIRGDVEAASAAGKEVLVRVQSVNLANDTLSLRPYLVNSLRAIDREQLGVFLYVFNKSRVSLTSQLVRAAMERPASAHPGKSDAVSSTALRDFGLGAQVLADIGCRKIRLLSNTGRKIPGLEGFGIEVVERVEIPTDSGADLVALPGGADVKR